MAHWRGVRRHIPGSASPDVVIDDQGGTALVAVTDRWEDPFARASPGAHPGAGIGFDLAVATDEGRGLRRRCEQPEDAASPPCLTDVSAQPCSARPRAFPQPAANSAIICQTMQGVRRGSVRGRRDRG